MKVLDILTGGLKGFAVFFSSIIIVEITLYLFGISSSFKIEIMDVYTSSLGIIFFIIISLTKKAVIK